MAFRLSNNLIGVLNFVTFLLSVPILGAGIWLGHRADGTECERYLSAPVIAFGAFLLAVSLAGLVGACCRVTWLLWVYLLAMFALIVALFCLTVFAFAVTNRGAGEAVSGRGYKEYRLGDYSNWLQKRVESTKNWNRIRSCLQDSKVCKSLQDSRETFADFIRSDLSPIQVCMLCSIISLIFPLFLTCMHALLFLHLQFQFVRAKKSTHQKLIRNISFQPNKKKIKKINFNFSRVVVLSFCWLLIAIAM